MSSKSTNHGVINEARLLTTLDHALSQNGTTEHVEQLQNSQDLYRVADLFGEFDTCQMAIIAVKYVEFVRDFLNGSGEFTYEPA